MVVARFPNVQVTTEDDKYTKVLDYGAEGLVVYMGEAAPGTAKATSGWRIYKLIYDSEDNVTDILWANGDDVFDKVWDDRANYAYS
jgi:hypothetical protein